MWHNFLRHLLAILLICASLPLFGIRLTPALAQDTPLVLAFYYAWYDRDTWSTETLSDQPALPYVSDDGTTIERHVAQAQTAGIDALIQSWYGPREADNQTETNFRTLLDVAAGKGFHAAVDFETTGPFFPDRTSVTNGLRALLSTHAQHPAYLRHQGRPVIFFWRQQRFSVEEWDAIRSQVDPQHDSLWIAEGVDVAYLDIFDGLHLYSVAWSSNPAQTLSDWGSRTRRYQTDANAPRLWVATALPGYDDRGTGRDDAFAVDRQDGGYYRDTWAAAVASEPDWIVITSFNEWPEGTMIEPSVTYGDLYLDLTRELSSRFKETSLPTVVPTPHTPDSNSDSASPTQASPAASPDPAGPFVRADETVRIRSGPGTQYERIGRLRQGETAAVTGQDPAGTWWQIRVTEEETEDGLGWVTAKFVTLEGDADTVPIIESQTSTPPPPATATATPVSAPQSTTTPPPPASSTLVPAPGPTARQSATPALLQTVEGAVTPAATWLFTTPDAVASTPAPALATASPAVSQTRMTPDSSPSQPTSTPPPPSPTSTMRRVPGERKGSPSLLLWIGIASLLGAGSLLGAVWLKARQNR
jgi:uncharacterized protein YraI